jgi:hypothetical protein
MINKVKLLPIPQEYRASDQYRILVPFETFTDQAAKGFIFPPYRVTSSYTMAIEDACILADATSGAITVTLKPAAECEGKRVTVKKIDSSANAVTIDADGSETIDGATTKSLASQYNFMELISEGGAWWIVSQS